MITIPRWVDEAGYGFHNKFYELKNTLILQGDIKELSNTEIQGLTQEQLEWLGYKEGLKVYQLTKKYFEERKGG